MKKAAVLLLAIALIATLAACDSETESSTPAAVPATASAELTSSAASGTSSSEPASASPAPGTSTPSASASVAPVSYAEVTAVELDSKPVVMLGKGETSQIRAAAVPNNISPSDKVLSYIIDNPAVATVSTTGLITYVGEGTAKVTATSANGKKIVVTVTCKSATPAPSSGSTSGESNSIVDSDDNQSSSGSSIGSTDDMIEVDDSHDQRKWEAGVSVPMTAYYDGSQSFEKVCEEISSMVKAYGYTVSGSGMINNGSSTSAGYIRILPESGRFGIVIYNWRKSPTDSGMNKSINSALVTMKYFLGDENGKTLWKLFDATQTKVSNDAGDFNVVDDGGNSDIGNFIFEDGTYVEYDYSESPRQVIFYFN